MNEHVLLSCHLLDAVMCWLLMLQWSPNNRLLLFGTSAGEVLIHDSAGELIVSVVYALPFTKSAYYRGKVMQLCWCRLITTFYKLFHPSYH